MANFYRIEELTTEGWTLIEDQAARITKEKCDELLTQYVNGGQNPNRLRAVAVQIEIATKPRPQCDLSTFFHKRIHVCLCCYEDNWHELEFIRRRVSKQDDSDPDLISYGAYKSQQHRPLDVQ